MLFDHLSQRAKAILATSAVGMYILAFVPLYHRLGDETGALALLPVALIALLFGLKAGLVAGTAAIPLHVMLLSFAGERGLDAIMVAGSVPGHAILIAVGGIIGWLRDLSRHLHRQNALRQASEQSLRRRAEELTALHETALDITRPRDLSALLETIIGRAVRLLDAHSGVLYVCDPERRELRCVAGHQTERQYANVVHDYGEGAAGIVAETGDPLIINDYQNWSGRLTVYQGDEHFTAVVSAPMIWQETVTGVLNVYHDLKTHCFNQSDLDLLCRFAEQAAIAVENARLFESAQRRAREAETLRDVASALTSTLNRDELLDGILVNLKRVIPYDSACVFLRKDNQLQAVAGRGHENPEKVLGRMYPSDSLLSREIKRTGRPVILADAHADPRFQGWADTKEVRGWMGIPLNMRGTIIGHITVDSMQIGAYGEADAELAQAFADHAAVALENVRLYEETYNRLREVTLLSHAITLTATADDLISALEELCAELARFFATPQAACALLNAERTEAEVVAEYCAPGRPTAAGSVFPVAGNPSMQYILEHKVPLAIPDAQTDPRLAPAHDVMRRRGTASLLLVPILVGDEVAGTLGIDALERRDFSTSDIELMLQIARQVGHSLERLRLFTATREHDTLMATLANISENLNRPFTVEGVVAAIGRSALMLSGTQRAVIYVRLSNKEVRCAWSEGVSRTYLEHAIDQAHKLPGGRLMDSTEPVLIPAVDDLPPQSILHELAADEGFQAVALWPLIYEGRAIAAVSCYYDTAHSWSEAEYEVMEAFTRQAAVALENARLYEKAQVQAATDGLTGLYNSRHFYVELAKEIERSQRQDYYCSLIMLDLDNFKVYNDRYGHLAGDDLLRELASLIEEVVRSSDTPARYGGEEFAIILPETECRNAMQIAERLRRHVEEHDFIVRDAQQVGRITTSIGVATYPTHALTREHLINSTDQALLRAKEIKNHVCSAATSLLSAVPS